MALGLIPNAFRATSGVTGKSRKSNYERKKRPANASYRGCVTPKIIANMVETVGEEGERDWSALDGYDELPEELQVKVRRAIEQGHVDDEDWKGVSSLTAFLISHHFCT